jgi:four helix bundle protein
MRLSIEVTPEQHARLKAVAALRNQSIKDYVLERVLPPPPETEPQSGEEALRQLEEFLRPRIEAAGRGESSNIAEGHSRFHTKEFLNHLSIARGSLAELETQLMISQRVGYLEQEKLTQVLAMTDEIGRMTAGLRHALEAKLT